MLSPIKKRQFKIRVMKNNFKTKNTNMGKAKNTNMGKFTFSEKRSIQKMLKCISC